MRGLDPDEYAVCCIIAAPLRDFPPPSLGEEAACDRLLLQGRIRAIRCSCPAGHLIPQLTPAGREAMRLHALISAMGAA
jgi:hypothetical protein